jgi:hypothetical protein
LPRNPILILALVLPLALAARHAAAGARPLTPTVSVEGLDVRLDDVIVKAKTGYAYLMWDAFPYRQAISAAAKVRGLDDAPYRDRVLQGLAKTLLGRLAKRGVRKFKADAVEFPERDEYGAPRWASVRKLQHLEAELPAPSAGGKP